MGRRRTFNDVDLVQPPDSVAIIDEKDIYKVPAEEHSITCPAPRRHKAKKTESDRESTATLAGPNIYTPTHRQESVRIFSKQPAYVAARRGSIIEKKACRKLPIEFLVNTTQKSRYGKQWARLVNYCAYRDRAWDSARSYV